MEAVVWIHLSLDKGQQQALVNKVIKRDVHKWRRISNS
jgi:hypothetical protein